MVKYGEQQSQHHHPSAQVILTLNLIYLSLRGFKYIYDRKTQVPSEVKNKKEEEKETEKYSWCVRCFQLFDSAIIFKLTAVKFSHVWNSLLEVKNLINDFSIIKFYFYKFM